MPISIQGFRFLIYFVIIWQIAIYFFLFGVSFLPHTVKQPSNVSIRLFVLVFKLGYFELKISKLRGCFLNPCFLNPWGGGVHTCTHAYNTHTHACGRAAQSKHM